MEAGRVEQAEEGAGWHCKVTGLALLQTAQIMMLETTSHPKIITSIHGKIMPVSHQQRVFSIGWCAVIIMSIPRPEVQHSLDACRILCFARNGGTIPRKQAKRQGHPQHFKSPGLLWRFWRVTTML